MHSHEQKWIHWPNKNQQKSVFGFLEFDFNQIIVNLCVWGLVLRSYWSYGDLELTILTIHVFFISS